MAVLTVTSHKQIRRFTTSLYFPFAYKARDFTSPKGTLKTKTQEQKNRTNKRSPLTLSKKTKFLHSIFFCIFSISLLNGADTMVRSDTTFNPMDTQRGAKAIVTLQQTPSSSMTHSFWLTFAQWVSSRNPSFLPNARNRKHFAMVLERLMLSCVQRASGEDFLAIGNMPFLNGHRINTVPRPLMATYQPPLPLVFIKLH